MESNIIISKLLGNKVNYLGFHLNHQYFKNIQKNFKKNMNHIKFCCMGGLNSLSRKNVDLIIRSFYNLYNQNEYFDWELNVYIQGVEIPDIVNMYKCSKINYFIKQLSYQEIISKYIDNDIFIHMGSHEGLGLGFYESLYCGTPILTMDWIPNNELIFDYINGWLIECNSSNIYDNNNSIINQGVISDNNLLNKIIEILNDDKTIDIINNTIKNKDFLINSNKIKFEKNLNYILN
jgi:glycosyltransferase involved in cell wall biosynthesis